MLERQHLCVSGAYVSARLRQTQLAGISIRLFHANRLGVYVTLWAWGMENDWHGMAHAQGCRGGWMYDECCECT